MEFIDTHAHLYASEFEEDRSEVVKKAMDAGVGKVILPAIDKSTHKQMMELAAEYPNQLYPLIGLHPTSVKENYKEELDVVASYLKQAHLFKGIGEIGVDLYWDKTFKNEQIDALETQLKWAKELKLPVVIHTRESFNEVYEVLAPMADDSLKGIFHCFGGSVEEAEKIIDLGFLLGIGGVLTFKNSKLRDVVQQIDINHIVLETDSPYLAPTPHRGKRNQSSYIPLVANVLADVYGVELAQVAKLTSDNAKRVFNL